MNRGPLNKHTDASHGHDVHPKNPTTKELTPRDSTGLWCQKSGSRVLSGEGEGANGRAQWEFSGAGRGPFLELGDGFSSVFSP